MKFPHCGPFRYLYLSLSIFSHYSEGSENTLSRDCTPTPPGNGNVYAQNLDLHLHTTDDDVPPRGEDPEQRTNEFFQPEPTLLDIAAGAEGQLNEPPMSPQETLVPETTFVHRLVKIDQHCGNLGMHSVEIS